MIKTYIIENLFDDVSLYDVLQFLAEESGKEIPLWASYGIYEIENIYPLTRYHANLHEGPVENQGKIVAYATIDIVAGENKAEVFVEFMENN